MYVGVFYGDDKYNADVKTCSVKDFSISRLRHSTRRCIFFSVFALNNLVLQLTCSYRGGNAGPWKSIPMQSSSRNGPRITSLISGMPTISLRRDHYKSCDNMPLPRRLIFITNIIWLYHESKMDIFVINRKACTYRPTYITRFDRLHNKIQCVQLSKSHYSFN